MASQFCRVTVAAPPSIALHDAGHQLPLFSFVFVEQGVAFGFAHLLNDDLLGGLCADAAGGFFRIERNAVVRARNRAVFAIDGDDDFLVFAVLLLGGGDQRRLDGQENDLLVDVLVTMDRVDDPQQLISVHAGLHASPHFGGLIKLSELSELSDRQIVGQCRKDAAGNGQDATSANSEIHKNMVPKKQQPVPLRVANCCPLCIRSAGA